MIELNEINEIYLYTGTTDFRYGIYGLSKIVLLEKDNEIQEKDNQIEKQEIELRDLRIKFDKLILKYENEHQRQMRDVRLIRLKIYLKTIKDI